MFEMYKIPNRIQLYTALQLSLYKPLHAKAQ
jgi:hypothetical protein